MVELSYLKKYGVEGKIGFTISSEDTPDNKEVYNSFIAYAKEEANNDYTIALKRLLEHIQTDYKYEVLFDAIKLLEERVLVLETAEKTNTKEEKHLAFWGKNDGRHIWNIRRKSKY